ncbi:ABC transporter permease [Treponema sp. OMZ 788]|uniref:ABC transporter permease n=1 Tax=Treponema sp. OMZ 788 TaxID=2563664 RepID=UPI0020A51A74|nr:ABC transporter permease [Treponema sp. OMZ 788]UTC64008.1 ABC transporter permease [Treponema sp. OMZ 788]
MVQSFNFTFKVLRNTKGFIVSMIIMPIFMILLVSITLAYSNVPTVAYIGEKAPNVTNIKMMKIEEREKDYFLGLSQGTLVIRTNRHGEVEKYYSSIENNPLIPLIENTDKNAEVFTEGPSINYSIGTMLFKLLTAAGLLATVLIQEKGNGILLRVKNSKTKLSTYILGKSFAIMFVYEIATLAILTFYKFANYDFGKSNIVDLAIIFTVALFISTGIYIFVAGVIKNEGLIWGISSGIIFPLGICSGILFPIEYMPQWMKTIAHLSPLYYMQHSITSGKLETVPIVIMLSISLILGLIGIRLIEKGK